VGRLAAGLGDTDGTMKILHVGVGNLGEGGVATYARTVISGQRIRGHEVLLSELWPCGQSMPEVEEVVSDQASLLSLRDRWKPDVVHMHALLPDYVGFTSAIVLTAHEHSSHCPSGGRYLEARGRECHRKFGLLPCVWGHYVDRCGSRDPKAILRHYRVTAAASTFPGIWIAPSRYSRDRLLERGMPPDRVELVSNPPPENFDAPPPEGRMTDPVVLFLGRLVPSKGCDVLLRAMVEIPHGRLKILGDGPERNSLEELAKRLGVDSRTEFLGWNSPAQVEGHLATARVLAVPARWPEPFGLVALEAYSSGCPVVASGIGGLLDTVEDGVTGRLVPPGDASALALALGELLRDGAVADRMGRQGHRLVRERFRKGLHLERLEQVYDRARKA